MTFLVFQLASCLFFAQLLGLLLGWLLWGYLAKQRGKEIVVLRGRLAEASQHTLRPADGPARAGALLSARDFKGVSGLPEGVMADLPPLPPLTPEPDEAAEPVKKKELPPSAPSKQETALKAQVEAAVTERDHALSELKAARAELETRAGAGSQFERRISALQIEANAAIGEREKAQDDLRKAKLDFDKRSAWMTKRIHELELAVRSEAAKSHSAAQASTASERDLHSAELADLKERLEKALSERDGLAGELTLQKQRQTEPPEQLAELQEAVRTKDAQLAEQVARVERLLWRVAELEPFAATVTKLEETVRAKDAEILTLAAGQAERDAHIRTILGRMTELEPLTNSVAELKELVSNRENELAQHTARYSMLETSFAEREKTISDLHAAQAERDRELAALRQRLAELETSVAGKAQEAERMQAQLREAADLHRAELTRVKTSSAQRVKRLRQVVKGIS
jgi:chromosome segregation ATPase